MIEFSVTLNTSVAGVDFQLQVPVLNLGDNTAEKTESIAAVGDREYLVQELKRKFEQDGTAQRLGAAGETLDDACVSRWLVARGNDPSCAEEAIRTHAVWREEYVPNGRISEAEVLNEIRAQKVFLQGHDNKGQALLVVHARKHDMGDRNIEETERFICYVLDNSGALASQREESAGKICVIFDLSGLRLKNLDVKGLGAIFDLLQRHYPERLACLWFLNAPFIFWGVWRVVSPFINENTREKIRFISASRDCQFLKDTVPLDVLPSCYGGDGELIPIERAVVDYGLADGVSVESIDIAPKRETFSKVRFWKRTGGEKKLSERLWWPRMGMWRFKGLLNNRVTRAAGNYAISGTKAVGNYTLSGTRAVKNYTRTGFNTMKARVLRHRSHPHDQVPLRLIPKQKPNRFAMLGRRNPVSKIVVKVIVAELVILAIAGARTVVFNAWGPASSEL
ncbi:hypothetical protein BSKO_00263 [Bryopsis sp. KO-2023]|nr:hypothetical protein BSKO_00263 [Bryopsis sp. KO-2023]